MSEPLKKEEKKEKGSRSGLWSTASYRASEILLAILLVISVGVNYYLTREVRQLRDAMATAQARGRLEVGAEVPGFQAQDMMSGETLKVEYADSKVPTILYVLSPTCGWCDRNVDNIRQVAANLKGNYRIFGLTLSLQNFDRLKDEDHRLDFPILGELDPQVIQAYQLGGTPQTVVVSPQGKVLKNWVGAYAGPVASDIESFFAVKLPGLRELTSDPHAAASGSR